MSSHPQERERWNALATLDPYWAVCTEERFRSASMSADARRAFFASGEREVADTFSLIAEQIGGGFRPRSALDYGCGVGRLLLPIARRSGRVVGVDISDDMLREARSNAAEQGIDNVSFQRPEEALAVSGRDLDFVHSYIVFQHIEPAVGLDITRGLLGRLAAGGVARLHYTHARRATLLRRISHRVRLRWPMLNVVVNALRGRRLDEPMIPVYEYDLARLREMFASLGCRVLHEAGTDHGGYLGVLFLLRRD